MNDVLRFTARQERIPAPADLRNELDAEASRVAVVGGGAWGANLVRCFADLERLHSVVDTHPEKAASLARRYGGEPAELERVLADPAIGAIAVATPPASHHAIAKLALEAGKHVLVEKPLTLDLEDAAELAELARRTDRRLMVGHVLQYHPAVAKLRELIADGVIGRVLRLHANRLNLGAIRRDEDVLWCLGPHDVSVILSLVGAEPCGVAAFGGFHLREGTADAVTMHLAFPGGEQAQINLSWLHPIKEHRLAVIGTQGMLVFDDGEPWERKLMLYPHQVDVGGERPSATRAEPLAVPLEAAEPLRLECEHFLNAVRFGFEPRTGAEEALRVMRTLVRAGEAMRERSFDLRLPAASPAEHRIAASA